jgi:hypothetical protein
LFFSRCGGNNTQTDPPDIPVSAIIGTWESVDTIRYLVGVDLGAALHIEHRVLEINQTAFTYNFKDNTVYTDGPLITDSLYTAGSWTYENRVIRFVSADTVFRGTVSVDKLILDTDFPKYKLYFYKQDPIY